jgi:hypothetical protein
VYLTVPDALELIRKDMSDNLNYRLRRSESCRFESVIGAGLLACPIGCIMAGVLFILSLGIGFFARVFPSRGIAARIHSHPNAVLTEPWSRGGVRYGSC